MLLPCPFHVQMQALHPQPLGALLIFALLFQASAGQQCADVYAWHLEGPLQAQGSAFVKQFSEYWSNFAWKAASFFSND